MPDREEQPTEESLDSGEMDMTHDSGPALQRTGAKKPKRKFNRKVTKVVKAEVREKIGGFLQDKMRLEENETPTMREEKLITIG